MIRLEMRILLLLALALLAGPRPAHAAESYDNCAGFITSLPVVIATKGTWCLKSDLSTAITSGVAITITSDDVTIDCNNFKLGGLLAGSGTQTYGIYEHDQLYDTVRNCNVRGFYRGVFFIGTVGGGHAVEDNRLDGNTYSGVWVEGDGSVVRRNRVFDTGASTIQSEAYGIGTTNSVDIIDNTVSGVSTTGAANGTPYGIYTGSNANGRISGNGISGLVSTGTGLAHGIFSTASSRITVHDNDLIGDAAVGTVGLYCTNSNGRAKDNVISGFGTATSNCHDSGGNAVIP